MVFFFGFRSALEELGFFLYLMKMKKCITVISFASFFFMANIASAFFWYDWFKNNNSPKAIISPTKTSQAQENKAEKVPTEIPAEKKEMSEKQVFQEQKPSFFTYPKTEKKKNHLFVPASKKSISGFYDDPLDNFWPDDLVDQVFNNDPFFSRHRNMMQRLYDPFHNHFGVSPRSMKHFSQFSQQIL